MKKGTTILLFLIIFLTMALLSNAIAANFDEIYMVGSDGSTTQKTTFDWNETPWLYLKLPSVQLWNFTITWWYSPSGSDYHTYDFDMLTQEVWVSLDNGVSWDDVKEVGVWNVDAKATGLPNLYVAGSTAFTVVPEPVSSTLFLAGAATLGFRRFRNRHKV